MSRFKISQPGQAAPESPAGLFHDLRDRSPAVKFLWGHQASLLDSYFKDHLSTRDLAIELPTGAGKTLVAILIAEYQRRAKKRRVAYLCPTRQLATQVAQQAKTYGVHTSLLVGRQRDYDQASFLKYQRGEAIAITTYSGIFNDRPQIDSPQLLICDDAHAAEQFVASRWSVRIDHRSSQSAFQAVARVLRDVMPREVRQAIERQEGLSDQRRYVNLASGVITHSLHPQLREALESLAQDQQSISREEWTWAWKNIKDHLDACSIYCSAQSFEIRPAIAPTFSHLPFDQAEQRVYLSATLGLDGGGERMFGRKQIHKLPVPEEWERHGIGRRLILFPGYSIDEDGMDATLRLSAATDRALVLVPDNLRLKRVEDSLGSREVVKAADIEDSVDSFTDRDDGAVLLVANRWEGLDLPGAACRMLCIVGMPSGAGLQEQYLLDRLGAFAQLRDRIRTRITQALGRCTRDASDHAVVLLAGNDLLKWCCTSSNLLGMHPEVQAEIEFGILNSEDVSEDEMRGLIETFLEQGDEWAEADAEIGKLRDVRKREVDPTASALASSVRHEVCFVESMWNGDFREGVSAALRATEALSGGDDLKAYRSFWHHQAAVAASISYASSDVDSDRVTTVQQLDAAIKTSKGLLWLGPIRDQFGERGRASEQEESSFDVRSWYLQLERLLENWGVRGTRFHKEIEQVRELLEKSDDAKSFEQGLHGLGMMLGAFSHRWPNADQGAPDGLWVFGGDQGFVFECKTEESPRLESLKTIRQALTHADKVRADELVRSSSRLTTVIVSRHTGVDPGAIPSLRGLCHACPSTLLDLHDQAAIALGQLRDLTSTVAPDLLPERAEDIFLERKCSVAEVVELLSVPLQ